MASDMRLNDKPIAKDGAYIYAEAADGSQVKISKADLAAVVAGVIGMKVLKITVPAASTLNVGMFYGFFALRCTTGSGYESYSIAGYANPETQQFLLDGYLTGAKFTDDGHLTITNPSSATSLTYIGYLIGEQKS